MPPTKKSGGAPKAAAAKKPGPKPGPKPKRVKRAAGKKYNLFTRDGDDLKFVTTAQGANGDIAAVNAVKAGTLDPHTPVIALTDTAVAKETIVAPEEREPKYVVKKTSSSGRGRRKPAAKPAPAAEDPAPEPEASPEPEPAEEPKKPAARRGGRRGAGKGKKPAATSDNPFA